MGKTTGKDVKSVTQVTDPEIPAETMDTHLQNLWEAFKSIQKRWRKNKHNRKLRRKLAALESAIQKHALQLSQNQSDEICDRMQGNLGMKRTWQLLKHLLDPSNSKTDQAHQLTHIIQNFTGSDTDLIYRIKDAYLPKTTNDLIPPYTGTDNTTRAWTGTLPKQRLGQPYSNYDLAQPWGLIKSPITC